MQRSPRAPSEAIPDAQTFLSRLGLVLVLVTPFSLLKYFVSFLRLVYVFLDELDVELIFIQIEVII